MPYDIVFSKQHLPQQIVYSDQINTLEDYKIIWKKQASDPVGSTASDEIWLWVDNSQNLIMKVGSTTYQLNNAGSVGAHKTQHTKDGSDPFLKTDILSCVARYFEQLSSDPATPDSARLWLDTTTKKLKFFDNTTPTPVARTIEQTSMKDVANGYAGLDGSGLATPSVLPDASISAKGVVNTTTQSFAGIKTIEQDNERILKLYRPQNTVGNKVGIEFQHKNSTPTTKEFGQIVAEIITNTAGSEESKVNLVAMIGGSSTTVANFGKLIDLKKATSLSGILTPAQITSDQNDYNPAGLDSTTVLRLDTNAIRNITGLQGGLTGRIITIDNIGSNPIVLKRLNGSSSSANQFDIFDDYVILPKQACVLKYDLTSTKWRLISESGFRSRMAYKTGDQALTNAYADVTDLTFSIDANAVYFFDFYLMCDADATTTGIDVAVNGAASPTSLHYSQLYWTSATAQSTVGATAYDNNTASTGSNGTAQKIFRVWGVVRNGVNAGTLAARVKRENVGSGTCRAGSYGMIVRVA